MLLHRVPNCRTWWPFKGYYSCSSRPPLRWRADLLGDIGACLLVIGGVINRLSRIIKRVSGCTTHLQAPKSVPPPNPCWFIWGTVASNYGFKNQPQRFWGASWAWGLQPHGLCRALPRTARPTPVAAHADARPWAALTDCLHHHHELSRTQPPPPRVQSGSSPGRSRSPAGMLISGPEC